MRNRTLGVLLAVMLLLPFCQARATQESALGDGSRRMVSAAACRGAIYTAWEDGALECLNPATREATPVGQYLYAAYADDVPESGAPGGDDAVPVFTDLFSDGTTLYGLCSIGGAAYTLLDSEGAYAPKLLPQALATEPWQKTVGGDTYAANVLSLFAQDGSLYYATTFDPMQAEVTVGKIDLATGELTAFQPRRYRGIAPWNGGMLLCVLSDSASADGAGGSLAGCTYGLLDPQTDSYHEIGSIAPDTQAGWQGVSGVCGNPETAELYYVSGSRIMALSIATGDVQGSAYTDAGLADGFVSSGQCFAVNGYYARKDVDRLALFKLGSGTSQAEVLRVFGEYGGEAHKSFAVNYPDIPVDIGLGGLHDLESLVGAMLSESDTFDVLRLNMSYRPVERLLAKGYAADLSDNAEIVALASGMNPRYTEPLTVDGKLCAVPVALNCSGYYLNTELWASLGLTDADVPASLPELLAFLGDWQDTYEDAFPEIRLLNTQLMAGELLSKLVQDYEGYLHVRGEALAFDTPLFRELLSLYAAIDFQALEGDTATEETSFVQEPTLFMNESVMFLSYAPPNYRLLSLPVVAGQPPALRVDMDVLLVNPKTRKMDWSQQYIENYLRNLSTQDALIELYPDQNEPVESNFYRTNRALAEQQLADTQALLSKADESARAEAEASVASAQASLAALEDYRYDVTPEAIAHYRSDVEPYLWVNTDNNTFAGAEGAVTSLLSQYRQQALTADQLIAAMDQQARMIALEGK